MEQDRFRKKLSDVLYKGIVYERDIPAMDMWRIYRVRMFEMGHSFAEIDRTSLDDIGDVLGYWTEKNRAEQRLKEEKDALDGNE